MKKVLLAACLAGAVLVPYPAMAQTTTVEIEPAQRTAIREYITRERHTSVAVPSGVRLSVGATLPETVELRTFPQTVGVRYRYVVMDNKTVLVDPGTRRVIQILE